MKFIVLLVVIAALIWIARGARRRVGRREAPPPAAPPQEAMVACAQCGLHLPRGESLPGRGGVFCSEAHRAAFEQQPQD